MEVHHRDMVKGEAQFLLGLPNNARLAEMVLALPLQGGDTGSNPVLGTNFL